MEISDIRKKLDSLTGSLDKLQLPANVTKNLEAALTKTLNQLNNFEALSERGLENLSDTKNLEKSWASVVNSLNGISAALKSIDTSKVFPKEVKDNIKAAEDAMAKYVQKLEQAKQSPKYQAEESKRGQILANETQAQKNLANAQNALAKAETVLAEKRGAWGEAAQQRYAEEEQNLKDINELYRLQEELIQRLEKEKEQLQSEGYLNSKNEAYAVSTLTKNGLTDTNKIKRASALGKELSAAKTEKTYYGAAREKAQKNFDKAKKPKEDFERAEENVQTLNKDVEEYTKLLQSAQEATAAFEQTLENIAKGEAAGFWKKLVDTLSKIPGLKLNDAADDIEDIGEALSKYKTQELDKVPRVMEDIKQEFKETEGPIKKVDNALRETGKKSEDLAKASDEIEHLKQQVLDFFSVSNSINIFKRALSSAFDTVKELDAVMTEAAVVTDFSIGDMWDQMPQYSKNASELGVVTKELYAATTLYYQQGLKGNDVMKIGAETMKMAKIASMDAAEATQAMTAALRGFNMEVNEMNAQKVNDVYSKLAAITAADTSQIATAMSKTASIAASANMEFETTAAFLAQIIETTQEAPETAGTALKTIIARFSEVKELQSQGLMTGVDAEGEAIDINKISTALRSVGISMDAFFTGQEGLDEVLLRLSEKWNTLDFTTQHYIATTAAGSRQQSRFMAMMSNYGRTMELVGEANNSAGASQEQYEKTLESLKSKLAQLKNAWDQFTMGLANSEVLKAGVDTLTLILETVNKLTDAISGGNGLVKSLASLTTVIGALKLGGKILGKNSATGGLLGKVGGMLGVKDNSKNEYKRGVKDGDAYGKGWKAGVDKATKNIPAPEFEGFDKGKKNAEDLAGGFNKVGLAVSGAGLALGLLSAAFESAGMEEAAEVTGILAATFTAMSVIIPIVGKLFTALGGEAAMAGVVAQHGWGWISAIALAITAIIAGIAVVVSSAMKAAKERSLEYKLEQAQKATEDAKKAAEEAKTAYEDLLNTKNKYSNTQDTLKKLTKGTREWRAALLEANQQVLEIQEKYSHLGITAETGENGLLTLSEDSWAKIEEHLLQISQANQAAYVGGQMETDSLGVDILRRDLDELKSARERLQASKDEAELSYAERGQISYNQTIPYYAAGQAQQQAMGDLDKKLADFDESIEEQTQKYNEAMNELNKKLGLYAQSLTGYVSKETSESDFYTKAGLAIAKNKGVEIEGQIDDRTKELVSKSEPALRALYKQTFGRDPGEEATTETMARELATVDVSKSVSGQVDQVVGLIEKKIQDPSTQRVVAAALSGDSSGLTMNELGVLKGMDQQQIASALGLTGDELQKITGLTDDIVQKNKDDYGSTYKHLYDKIGPQAYNKNAGFLGGLQIETLSGLVNQTGFGEMNDAQKTALITSLQEVLSDKDLAEGEANILGNLLTSTDWTDPLKAMDTMDTMLSMGIDQDTIKKYWKAATAGVDAYVDSETEALQLAGRMQGKVKNLGDLSNRMAEGTLTVDDMVMLEKAGVNTSNYKLTAEGWQATSEEIAEATDKMREFYLMQTNKNLKDTWTAWVREKDPELWESYKILEKTREMLEQPITTTYKVETHIDLLDRIKEAIVFDRQKEIDKLSEINDTIADSNSRIVTAMRESVEDSRRARENEKTEQEIADKQARLSYLKMDTSGANAMEIKQLEEEIAQDQESYTDRLIDQKISALEEQNNIAQEQRAQQIELMQLQLEQEQQSGAFWGQVNELFKAAYNSKTGKLDENSEAVRLLQQAEGYQGLSAEAQQQWKDDLLSAFKEGVKVEVDIKFESTGGGVGTSFRGGKPTFFYDDLSGGLDTSGIVKAHKFASGGLADFTGPAWLDGTKTNPEYVLNAAQTERFFTLVDILEGLKVAPANSTQNNRENNFDIDINVESINSDYDVEQVAIKVKDFIVNSSRYRNNNTL